MDRDRLSRQRRRHGFLERTRSSTAPDEKGGAPAEVFRHELPDQDEPLHELPDHDDPLQLEPLHELPDQDEPFQKLPDQLWPAASKSAITAELNGLPKMSCSPWSTTPFSVR